MATFNTISAAAIGGGGGGASYLVYTALLTQSGTDAPVATVLENTLGGTVVWTRGNVGTYNGTLTNAFPINKTFIIIPNWYGGLTFGFARCIRLTDNSIRVETYDDAVGSNSIDGLFDPVQPAAIEIRVYP